MSECIIVLSQIVPHVSSCPARVMDTQPEPGEPHVEGAYRAVWAEALMAKTTPSRQAVGASENGNLPSCKKMDHVWEALVPTCPHRSIATVIPSRPWSSRP